MLRGVSSTIPDAQGSRIDNELGKRDNVTGTALEQGCELDEVADTPVVSGSRKKNENTELHKAVAGADGTDAAQGSEARQKPSKSKHFQQTIKIPQAKNEDHGDSPGQRIRKIIEVSRLEDSEERGDSSVAVYSQDGRCHC